METNKEAINDEIPLISSLRGLYTSGLHSDLTLVVKGVDLDAHKAILASRSPVFADLLQSAPTTDCNKTTLNINDLDVEVAKAMLAFIYTGTVEDMTKYAGPLLKAADKYALEDLLAECEKTLTNRITIENAANLLELSDASHAQSLKTSALEFIKINLVVVQLTNGWRNLKKSNLKLIDEVLPKKIHKPHGIGASEMLDHFTVEKTSSHVVETHFIWRVENFSFLHANGGHPLLSLPFCYRDNEKITWRLQLYPRGDAGTNEYLAVFLNLVASPYYPLLAKYEFALLDRDAVKMNWKHSGAPQEFTHRQRTLGYPNFIRRKILMNEKNGLIHKDTVVVYCKVTAVANRARQTRNKDLNNLQF